MQVNTVGTGNGFNSLPPGRCGCNLKLAIFKLVSRINILSISWNCLQVNGTETPWWLVNIGSDNGLVPSGIKPLFQPMLIKSYDKFYMTYRSFSEPYFVFYCIFWWYWCDIMWTALWNWMNFRVFIYQTGSFLFGHHYLFLTETVGNIWYMYLEELVQFEISDHWGMTNFTFISFIIQPSFLPFLHLTTTCWCRQGLIGSPLEAHT